MTVGYRVLICDNMAFSGDFTPVLAKHSKNFNLIHSLEIGVSEMQRNFEPMTKQVAHWRESQLTDVCAKLIIYQAFIEGDIDLPKHLARPGDSGEAERLFRREAERHSGMIPNTIGA
jgi:hypothetical protein